MQNLFARSPWERQSVVVLNYAGLGQNAPAMCELTSEGGQHCADGTYLPPGCAPGSPETIQAKPLLSSFPVVPVALAVVGAAVVGKLLLGDARMRLGAEIPSPALDQLNKISYSIQSEREADAYNFSQYQAKSKENLDLLEKERQAEINLREQNRLWEASHQNLEALQAAQAAVDGITAQRGTVKAEADEWRQRVDRNSQNVLYLRQQAEQIINGLPAEVQLDARRMIDPCAKPASGAMVMKGTFLGQVPLMGQSSAPQPSDFVAELAVYQTRAGMAPGGVPKQLQDTLTACHYYLTTAGAFSATRVRGCLNSAIAQLQALGV